MFADANIINHESWHKYIELFFGECISRKTDVLNEFIIIQLSAFVNYNDKASVLLNSKIFK